jgi:hypothetical protein
VQAFEWMYGLSFGEEVQMGTTARTDLRRPQQDRCEAEAREHTLLRRTYTCYSIRIATRGRATDVACYSGRAAGSRSGRL